MKMKIKSTILGLAALLLAGMVQAQEGWNFPSDPALESKTRELNAAYTDLMNSDQYIEATHPLHWLLVNVPNLNESIYQNGVKIYDAASKASTDETQKRVYQDSVILLYNKRGEIYNNEKEFIENKAYYGYQYYKGDKDMLAGPIADFEKAIELNGTINYQLTAAYFDLVYRNYAYHQAYTGEEILAIHDKINKLLDEAAAEGKDVSSQKGTLEQLLVAMELIDCDFIENTMGPKLAADPTNEVLADQIFKYSVQYKCFSSKAFLQALEMKHAKEPSFSTSQVIAMRYMQEDNTAKAEEMWSQALTLAESDSQKADAQMELAKIYAKQGKKSAARSAAREAANLDSSKTSDVYSMIAGMYMNSFNDCKGGVSVIKDRAIYIAAYNAYQRAGDSSGMAQARSQFPSKEEVFTEGMQVGQSLSTGCWIGETVTLATRD
jgi:tetratricopeptide (TPR) repeat protein